MNQVKPHKSHNRGRQAKTRRGQVPLWMFPVLAVLIIVAVLLTKNFVTDQTQTTVNEPTYQYYLDKRNDYSGEITLIEGEYGTIVCVDDRRSDGDPSPLYFANRAALLLVKDMSWVDPERDVEWLIPAYSEIRTDAQGNVWCTHNKDTYLLPGGFLSDCRGTTVFLEKTDLRVNGKTYTLSPLSFCSVLSGVYRVYSYQEEQLYQVEDLYDNIQLSVSRGYSADLTAGIFTGTTGTKRLMAASPKKLTDISKR